MSFFTRLHSAVGQATRAAAGSRTPTGRDGRYWRSGDGLFASPFIRPWTDSRWDQVRAFRHWTYIAIDRIAKRVCQQIPNVATLVRDPEFGGSKQFSHKTLDWYRFRRHKALTPTSQAELLEPVGSEHPLVRLLNDPNSPDTSFDLWYETVLFLELTGVAYWYVPRNKLNFPAAIWVIPSHWVWPVGGKDQVIDKFQIRPTESNLYTKDLNPDEVVVFRFKSPLSKTDGFSPQTAGAQWLDQDLAINRTRTNTFRNGAFPTAALEFNENILDPAAEDLDRIERKFLSRYAGEVNAGKPILLPPGIKFHSLSVTPRDMDYAVTADQMRDYILSLFAVPAVIAGVVKDVNHGVTDAAHAIFCAGAINPLYRLFGQVITEKLARPFDPSLRVYWDDTTPQDPKVVEEQLKNDMALGAVTPNELRIRRGYQPYAHGGDNPILPHMGIVLPYGTGNLDAEKNAGLFAKPKPESPAGSQSSPSSAS